MKRTFFIFGRTPRLALLELQALYPNASLILPDIAFVPEKVHAQDALHILGGTVKVAEELDCVSTIDASLLFEMLLPFVSEGKIVFGMSGYGNFHIPPSYFSTIKKLFLERNINVRYVEAKHQEALGSVVVAKQHLTELIIIAAGKEYYLGVTQAVQDFEDWNTRDSARPASDPHRGMLPPKVARMIVNIAIAGMNTPVVLDPFCGVGTIIAEALMQHVHAIGVDISEAQIIKAQKNIDWLRAHYGLLHLEAPRILVGDATHISELLPKNSVDAIVTEPFMGNQKETLNVHNTLKGLEKLYIGCLRDWTTVVKPGGRVVMATPAYITDRGIRTVKKVVDRCEILGYTLLAGPIEYSRQNAAVRREFYIFEKK